MNQQMQTDRTVPNNKPVILIRNNETLKCIIDAEIPGDGNMIKTAAEKILKHEDLTIKTQRVRNVKTSKTIMIRSTGGISKSLRKYLGIITIKHEIKELQKTAILSSAHILRKVLTSKYKKLIEGNNITCTTKCN